MSRIFILIYWVILLAHNARNLKSGGYIPHLMLANTLVLASLIFETF